MATKNGNDQWLKICYHCGKRFVCYSSDEWVYTAFWKKHTRHFCSYTCTRTFKRENNCENTKYKHGGY